tara:strand:- start:10700 stop:10867 length:168 start_codon:yes stop_codon:yes gene_type:complete
VPDRTHQAQAGAIDYRSRTQSNEDSQLLARRLSAGIASAADRTAGATLSAIELTG